MARDTHRILLHKDGGWQVKRDVGKRASHVADTKAVAERLGRVISRNQGTEFQVQRLRATVIAGLAKLVDDVNQ